jgi:hypothetical protein
MAWLAAASLYLLGCACGAAVVHWLHRAAAERDEPEQRPPREPPHLVHEGHSHPLRAA